MFDPSSLLLHLFAPFWWMLPLALLSALVRLPAVKGWLGEILLHATLTLVLPRARYHLLRNLTLPTADGSTQIDHVVVSRHGIFVIETKNYAGWIFGKPRDRTWTQKFPRRSNTFQNPLRQNYKHVRTLAELVGVDQSVLFSQIVFVGSCTFKTPMPANVGKLGACVAAIRGRQAQLLTDDDVTRVLERIRTGRLEPSRRTHAAHVRHVQDLVAARTRAPIALPAPAAPCCPRCGAGVDAYTFRTGPRTGQAFQGCIRFPACTYRADLPARHAEPVAA
jgi:restriction system protein